MTWDAEPARLAKEAWQLRWDDPARSVELAEAALRPTAQAAALLRGIATLTLAFHASRTADWASTTRHLVQAMGEFYFCRDPRGLALCEVIQVRLMLARDDFAAARDSLLRAQAARSYLAPSELLELHFELAAMDRRDGEIACAMSHLTLAAKVCPHVSTALQHLLRIGFALLLIRARLYRAALLELEQIPEDRVPAYLYLSRQANALACHLRLQDLERSRKLARQCLRAVQHGVAESEDNFAHVIAAVALAGAGEVEPARQLVERARAVCGRSPECRRSQFQLAIAEATLAMDSGEPLRAIECLLPHLTTRPPGLPSEVVAIGLEAIVACYQQTGQTEAARSWRESYAAHAAERTFGTGLNELFKSIIAGHAPGKALTAVEARYIELASRGLATADIAARVGRSPHTVKNQLSALRRRYQAANTRELVAKAVASGDVLLS
jgi:DNA-binding CsgD family transcriptional regulator